MYPYIIFLLAILFLSLFEKKLGKKKYLIISFLLMFVFIIIKDYHFFHDHDYYLEVFNYAKGGSIFRLFKNYSAEPGFLLLTYIVSFYTNNYYIFLTICAFISLIGPYIFIKNNSKNYKISILIYLFLSFFSLNYILRGSIALSIYLIALDNLRKKKVVNYIFLIILASCFHKTIIITSLVLIPYIFNHLNKNKDNKYIYITYMTTIALIFVFKKEIVNFLMNTLYKNYLGVEFKGGGYKLLIIICLISVIISFIKEKYMKEKDETLIDCFNLSIPFQILATNFGPINRITTYFMMPLIIIVPELIELQKEKKKYVEIGICIALCILLIIKMFTGSAFCEYHIFFIK